MANNSIRTNNLPVRILSFMAERDYRLSALKIAESLNVERRKVTSALQGLKDRKMVNNSGFGRGMMWGLVLEDIKVIQLSNAAELSSVPQFGVLIEHRIQANY